MKRKREKHYEYNTGLSDLVDDSITVENFVALGARLMEAFGGSAVLFLSDDEICYFKDEPMAEYKKRIEKAELAERKQYEKLKKKFET